MRKVENKVPCTGLNTDRTLGDSGQGTRRRSLLFVAMAACLLLSSCGSDESQIHWQLPLTPPDDPHGAQQAQPLPEWVAGRQGSVHLMLLQISTARTFEFDIAMGEVTEQQGVNISLLGLSANLRLKAGTYIEDENVHNPAAYVEVSEKGKLIYRGWLYQEFPELFGPDSPNWKLWLKQVNVLPLPDDAKKTSKLGARSSAG